MVFKEWLKSYEQNICLPINLMNKIGLIIGTLEFNQESTAGL